MAKQEALDEARAKLEATNVRVPEVELWLGRGDSRKPGEFERFVAGSPARKQILTNLVKAYDQRKQAAADLEAAYAQEKAITAVSPVDTLKLSQVRQAQDQARERHKKAEAEYNRLLTALSATNLEPASLDQIFRKRDKAARDRDIAAQKAAYPDYPARAQAVAAYLDAREAFNAAGAGLDSAADLKRLLAGSGVLEFHILPDVTQSFTGPPGDPTGGYQAWVKRLNTIGPQYQGVEDYRWFEVEDPQQFASRQTEVYDDRHWILGSVKLEESLDRRNLGGAWRLARAFDQRGDRGESVVAFNFDAAGGREFGTLTTRNVGRPMAIMLDGRVISAPNINTPITGGAGTITSGNPGGFSVKEKNYLVNMLNAGALPAQLGEQPIYERAVGPQLGEDNLRRGLIACGLGLVVVAVFLMSYYYLSGVVAFVAVLMNLVVILGVMAGIGATFTLPGIAAIVLTVGSAVDANVLIFERLREEQKRGLALRQAIRNAYDRAFSAILDSNMTTLITSAALWAFGTEEVKGFGITLIIGLLASLFTSLYVTKTIFGLLIDRWGVTKLGSLPLTYPKYDQMLRPNIRWTKLALPFAGFSVVFIVIGLGLFANYARQGRVLDIEFASGTAVTFELNDPTPQEKVRDWMNEQEKRAPQALPSPAVVRVGTDNRTWEVTTANADANAVREAILTAVGPNLKAELPSRFDHLGAKLVTPLGELATRPSGLVALQGGPIPLPATVDKPTTTPAATAPTAGATTANPSSTGPSTAPASMPTLATMPPVVLPITETTLTSSAYWPGGTVPEEARKFAGGAAIFLRNLNPPISPQAVAERFNRQRLQSSGGVNDARADKVGAVAATAGRPQTEPTDNVILLLSAPGLNYEKLKAADPTGLIDERWAQALEPFWEQATVAVNQPPKLQQVRNVDASVAGETQEKAAIALVLSVLFIVGYIWARFGNLKYGTATVLALVHDVLFCFAALGFAYLFSGNAIGDLLQLQPFRINLTIIAAVLTIMGYSMLDTIVVFDRIREIRGKLGHVSATVINDAVNQTLSRTLLTAGTTIVSVAIMYFIGGEGIHGFTFVLFVGILAGTYSSIAIASPILLVGGAKHEEAVDRGTKPATPATT